MAVGQGAIPGWDSLPLPSAHSPTRPASGPYLPGVGFDGKPGTGPVRGGGDDGFGGDAGGLGGWGLGMVGLSCRE
jgi:hypothetical protein